MSRGDLVSAIASAFVAVGQDSEKGNDLTSHFTFRASPVGIDMLSYNRVCHVCAPVRGTVEGDAEVCFSMDAKRLRGCMQAATGEDIRIQATQSCSELRVGTWSASIRGLPTARFPFWDTKLTNAKSLAKVAAGPFVTALAYVSKFAEQADTKQPALCGVYVVNGRMQATDTRSATYVDLPDLVGANFLLHVEAVSPLLNFFQKVEPTEVIEIFKLDQYLYVKRVDGAIFGCPLLATADPALQSPIQAVDAAKLNVSMNADAVRRALSFLDNVTSEAEYRVGVRAGGGEIKLSMRGEATSQDEVVSVEATCSNDAVVPFNVHRAAFKRILTNWKTDTVGIDVVQLAAVKGSAPTGYVRFRDTRDELTFHTMLTWIKR